MAFPSVATSATTDGTTASPTPVVNLPASIAAGDLLLVLFRSAELGAIGWPGGWTELFDDASDASDDQTAMAWRKADGGEGATITLSSTSGKFAAIAWRITGAADPTVQPPEFATLVIGASTTPDPGSLSPTGGAKDYLWLWCGGWEGEQTSPPASNPTNYASNILGANSGTSGVTSTNCRVASASRELNAASEDPGSWTISAGDQWTATVVAVHPGGPTAYTLAADPGSYGITGTAAGLLRGFALACDPGEYTTGTLVRKPTNDDLVSGTWSGSVGSRFSLVDDHPDSGGTDVVTASTEASVLHCGSAPFSVPAGATNIRLHIDYYGRRAAGTALDVRTRIVVGTGGGVSVNGPQHDPPTSLTLRTDSWPLNPVTGIAWTPDEINGVSGEKFQEFGWLYNTAGGPDADFASIQARVTFGPEATLIHGFGVSADPGSYAVTGTPANLLVARILTAEPGSYALAGTAAQLSRGFTLAANPGSYALNGTAAGLLATRILAAAPGSYTLNGTAESLLLGRRLAADPGAYVLSGTAAGLLAGRRLGADPGSYALSGTAASLLAARRLVADPGAYALTGTTAQLLAARILAADPGAYVIAGTDADLLFSQGFVLIADPGAYAIAGIAADLLQGRLLTADPGAYVIAGTTADLLQARVLAAEAGTYLVTGTAAELLFGRILVADPGAYLLAGLDADLLAGRVLGAEPGIYLVSGTAADLVLTGAIPPASLPRPPLYARVVSRGYAVIGST